MENNEFGFESLYMKGLGMSEESLTRPVTFSSEGYDGYEEAATIELEHAVESLNFLDTYSMIEQKNAADKIRMCKKLAVNYGLKSGVNEVAAKSIESLCNIQSLEAEAAAANVGAKTEKVKKPNTTTKDGAKTKWYQTIWNGIKRVFKAIGDFLKMIGSKIVGFVKGIFKKSPAKDVDAATVGVYTAAAAKANNVGGTEGSFFIVGGTVNTSAAKAVCSKTVSLSEKVGKFSNEVVHNAKADENKIKNDVEALKKEADGIISMFSVGGGKGVDPKIQVESSVQKMFGIKLALNNKQNIKAAAQWCAKADNINKLASDIEKLEGDVKNLNKCSDKCLKMADTLQSNYDKSEDLGDKDVLGRTLVDPLKKVANIQQQYAKTLHNLIKAFGNSYKMNKDMSKHSARKDTGNKASGNKASGTLAEKMDAANNAPTASQAASATADVA